MTQARWIGFEQCTSSAEAELIARLGRDFGPYRMYVEQPIQEGIGRGLVRRHDAILNRFKQGMRAGTMEPLDVFAARTNLFRGIYAELGDIKVPGIEPLYHHEGYAEAAKQLTGKSVIRPTMLYANLLVPGQELAVHTDTPEFRGLDKTRCPEWLLVAMHHSGLFERWRVHIVAAVSFSGDCEGGAFAFYPEGKDGPIERIPVKHNTAVALEVDDLFHGVERVGGPDLAAPPIGIGMTIEAAGESDWSVRDGEDEVIRYSDEAVRFSFQWKCQCFADEDQMAIVDDCSDDLSLEQVVTTLTKDLRARERITAEVPDDTGLAMMIIEEYIRFPSEA